MRYIIGLLLMTCSVVFSYTTILVESTTYLVYRQSFFPQDRYKISLDPLDYEYFIDSGKNTIELAKGQPIAKTEYTLNYNGKYAIWTVSPLLEDVSHINTMTTKNYIKKLSQVSVVKEKDETTGNETIKSITTIYGTIPDDFYEVKIST